MQNLDIRRDSSMLHSASRRPRRMLIVFAAVSTLATLLAVGCRDITSLQQLNPGQLSSTTVFTPANAQLIVNSSQGDFECAYNEYIVASGLFMDELANAISNTSNFDLDGRSITPGSPYGTSS